MKLIKEFTGVVKNVLTGSQSPRRPLCVDRQLRMEQLRREFKYIRHYTQNKKLRTSTMQFKTFVADGYVTGTINIGTRIVPFTAELTPKGQIRIGSVKLNLVKDFLKNSLNVAE